MYFFGNVFGNRSNLALGILGLASSIFVEVAQDSDVSMEALLVNNVFQTNMT